MMKTSIYATRWAAKLLSDFVDSRLDAMQLLSRIDRAFRLLACKPGGADKLRAALCDAFSEQAVEGESLRANVIVAVEGGDLRPGKAEIWADIFGWKHFAAWADPTTFDPLNEDYWTLGMTAAWIRWRDRATPVKTWVEPALTEEEMAVARCEAPFTDATFEFGEVVIDWTAQDRARTIDQVRRCSPEYIGRSTRWIETEDGGYVLGPREERGWSEVSGEYADTKLRLVEALKSGLLVARNYRNGQFVGIPQSDWASLRIVGFHDEIGVWQVIAPDSVALDGVRVTRGSIMNAFPSPPDIVAVYANKRKLTTAELKQYVEQSLYGDGQLMGADAIEKKMKEENRNCSGPRGWVN